MSQEIVAQILAIEETAVQTYDEARKQAGDLIAKAEEEASALRERVLDQTRQQAEQIIVEGREAAEAERTRVIAKAEAECQRLEVLAAQHLDRATNFVFDQVTGRE